MLLPWLGLSVLISAALLLTVYGVALLSAPDLTIFAIPGYNVQAGLEDYLHVLYRNSLVLALHALACVAGFIAGSSLPLAAEHRSGPSRWVHEKAGPLAIGFVVCATLFSLTTQAYIIGGTASSIARSARRRARHAAAGAAAARAARAGRPLPPTGGLGAGEPPGRMAGSLRRDPRDGGDRSAAAAGGSGDRDLGLPHFLHAIAS